MMSFIQQFYQDCLLKFAPMGFTPPCDFYPAPLFLPHLPHAAIFYPTSLPLLPSPYPMRYPAFTPPQIEGVLSINKENFSATMLFPIPYLI